MNADAKLLADIQAIASLPCPTGKHKHETKDAARRHVGSLRTNRDSTRTGAFRCGFCGFWHVGRR